MSEDWRAADLGTALRWLGSPVTVLCLAVLALNDQVLKQAWPGLVTGKLSDVAGLVVAPPLLAVVLTLCRVPWSAPVALGATAVGFALTKSLESGAEVASAVWSWSGYPTYIRHDLTDLLALPALVVAARVWVLARDSAESFRRALHLALGATLLPVAVLTTAATSCDPGSPVDSVWGVVGDFAGAPRVEEQRLVVSVGVAQYSVRATGEIERLAPVDEERLVPTESPNWAEKCDPSDRSRCWRPGMGTAPSVESTVDGGRTWQAEFELSDKQADHLTDEVGESCGEAPRVSVATVAVLGTADEPIVAAAVRDAGLLLRLPGGVWSLIEIDDLRSAEEPTTPGAPRGQLLEQAPLKPR